MNAQDVSRNARLYSWYVTFRDPIFWGPVLILSLMRLGKMELSDIYIMEGIVLIGFMVLEIPSGALADLIGRKKTIVVGALFQLASKIWFACITSPIDVWCANILWMIGASLTSGADSALLYDSLKEDGRESEYRKIEGRAMGNWLFLVAVGSLAAGFLAEYSLRLPAILSIPGVLFSSVLPFFFREPPATKKYTPREQIHIMKTSSLFVLRHKKVMWILGFTTMIAVVSKIWFFSYNPYFEIVALDLKYYGIVFFVLNMVAWYFSRYADFFSKKMSEKTIMKLMVFLVGVPILFMGSVISVFSVGMVFLQNVVRGFTKPFFGEFLNRHLDSENRATVLSIQSAVSGLAQFVLLGAFGLLLTVYGLPFCLQLLGGTALILGTWEILAYKKTFP